MDSKSVHYSSHNFPSSTPTCLHTVQRHMRTHHHKPLNVFYLLAELYLLFSLSTLPTLFPWKQEVVSPRTETVTAQCCAELCTNDISE